MPTRAFGIVSPARRLPVYADTLAQSKHCKWRHISAQPAQLTALYAYGICAKLTARGRRQSGISAMCSKRRTMATSAGAAQATAWLWNVRARSQTAHAQEVGLQKKTRPGHAYGCWKGTVKPSQHCTSRTTRSYVFHSFRTIERAYNGLRVR